MKTNNFAISRALELPAPQENIAVLLGTEKIPFNEFFKRMTAKLSPEDKASPRLRGFHYNYIYIYNII